jgi:hypothetical protein
MEAVGRAVVGAAGTGGPARGLAVRVRVALEDGMAAVAGVMGRAAVAVAVGGTSLEQVGQLSGSSPS